MISRLPQTFKVLSFSVFVNKGTWYNVCYSKIWFQLKALYVAFSLLSPLLGSQIPYLNSSRERKKISWDATLLNNHQTFLPFILRRNIESSTAQLRLKAERKQRDRRSSRLRRPTPQYNTIQSGGYLESLSSQSDCSFQRSEVIFFLNCFYFTESSSLFLSNVSLVSIIVCGFSLDFRQTKNGKRQERTTNTLKPEPSLTNGDRLSSTPVHLHFDMKVIWKINVKLNHETSELAISFFSFTLPRVWPRVSQWITCKIRLIRNGWH